MLLISSHHIFGQSLSLGAPYNSRQFQCSMISPKVIFFHIRKFGNPKLPISISWRSRRKKWEFSFSSLSSIPKKSFFFFHFGEDYVYRYVHLLLQVTGGGFEITKCSNVQIFSDVHLFKWLMLKCSFVQIMLLLKVSGSFKSHWGVRDCINSGGPLTQFPPKAHLTVFLHETSRSLQKCCPSESVCWGKVEKM